MKRYNVVNFCFAFINPFLGLISSLYSILRLKDASLYFAFSLALICVYFPIMYDTSVNFYSAHYSLYSGGVDDWLQPYISFPSYLMYNYNIDFYYFIFFNIVFVIYTWTKIVLKIFNNSLINYKSIFVLIFLIFSFNYRDLMDINRNIFSYSIFFYYYFLVDRKSVVKLTIFSFFAILIHSSALILVILYLLSSIRVSKTLNTFLLLTSLVCGYFLPEIVNKITALVEFIPVYGDKISYYLYGDTFGVQDFTFGTALKKLLNCFIIFLVSVCSIRLLDKNKENNRNLQFILLIGFFSLFFFNFVTFFERINLAYNFIFLSVFLYNIRLRYAIAIAFLIFFRSFCMYVLVYFPIFFGDYSAVLVNNHYKNQLMLKPFYYPTLFLLDIHNNGYSDEFISKNSIWREIK
ncbi:EpsG family protein [Acinetobacter gyllenbergii]|uniref:EpsG family protein n=1 Tax=Acinetobacter gyllenbergii TaxID=134534 RepID=UPI0003BF5783|nr:EpsG family protein [Acinetobacter gyllenbergii]ESK38519.1 hypothetical protein F987_03095 [Acinetobacter gyllenbergii NIPH 230]